MHTKTSRSAVIGSRLLAALIFTMAVLPAPSVVLTGTKDTPVDLALPMPQPRGSGLGTKSVKPDEDEKPFFDKLPADQVVTGSMLEGYDLAKNAGQYVGWCGIIRGIKEDPKANETTLTIQHTYSDGQTDTHIMTVSFNGAGDFTAKLRGTHLPLLPLRLVKVYGTAKKNGSDKPVVDAVFIKEWDWWNFNFMDYGQDGRNPQWKSANKISDSRQIYDPYPKAKYYRDRLGDAPACLYDVMKSDQVMRYAKKGPVEQTGVPEMALRLTAPLFVGQTVRVEAEDQGHSMPFAPAFRELSEYVEFVKAGMAGRIAAVDRTHVAQIEAGINVLVLKYALPDQLSSAAYLVRPQSGKYKDQEWWMPGFVLKARSLK